METWNFEFLQSGQFAFIDIAHWLIVTLFALFNALLMWIYRKRDSPAAPRIGSR